MLMANIEKLHETVHAKDDKMKKEIAKNVLLASKDTKEAASKFVNYVLKTEHQILENKVNALPTYE